MGEERSSCLDCEVSAVNPAARRRRGGIWNEDELPVLEWEAAEHRKVMPVSVQQVIGCGTSVVRVSRDILRKQYEKHADVRPMFEDFEIANWVYVRRVADVRGRKWEFVQLIDAAEEEAWPLMTVIGEDTSSSINLVSMHRRNRRWLKSVLDGKLGFAQRER